MSTISLRLSEEELGLFKDYAKVNNKSLSEVVRESVLSRIEDEYDIKMFSEYENDKANGRVETLSHEEAWSEIGVWNIK